MVHIRKVLSLLLLNIEYLFFTETCTNDFAASQERQEVMSSYGSFSVCEKDRLLDKRECMLGEKIVADQLECLHLCLSMEQCWSVNYGPQRKSSRSPVCQFLGWMGINYQQDLVEKTDFIHIKRLTPCESKLCEHGGTCMPTKTGLGFHCVCPKHYGGIYCEHCVIFDFEQGLSGWIKTGSAFNNQPTYGDNPTARGRGQPANQSGNWWIGTYENRPSPSSSVALQGDSPSGTLTSPEFIIKGDHLSFLIGGGCAIETSRAELVVSGKAVFNATGECSETMKEKKWKVKAFVGTKARLRLIDNSSDGWGHINFDHLLAEKC